MNKKFIPLDDAKASIVEALETFHPTLGAKAKEILYSDSRLNIYEQPYPVTGMMQCRPAGLSVDHLQKNDMVIPDFEKRFGPYFTDQENHSDYAIIDYEYTGTQQSILYLAHELGHAIADDIQRDHGRSYRDFSPDEAEKQAYFIQNIYAHHSGITSPESATSQKSNMLISWERVTQHHSAENAFHKSLSMSMKERADFITYILGGNATPPPTARKTTPKEKQPQPSRPNSRFGLR